MCENMKYYNIGRKVPDEAKKTIGAGKLKGFTDINPMWRIQMLTEMFGPCGIGWYIDDVRYWTEEGKDGRVAAFCELNLYIRREHKVWEGVEEWSKPIKGIGGSMFVNNFKGQFETSDEAYKMAYTDAISVATKAIGIGADVYWEAGRTKYSLLAEQQPVICTQCGATLKPDIKTKSGWLKAHEFAEKFGGLCPDCVVKKAVEMQGDPK